MKAMPDDPASRTNTLENAISLYLKSKGKQNILKMNTLVDELEGRQTKKLGEYPVAGLQKMRHVEDTNHLTDDSVGRHGQYRSRIGMQAF